MRIGWLVMMVLSVMLTGMVYGHEDDGGLLMKVEKVYETRKPFGRMTVTYVAADGEKKATLKIACDLFKGEAKAGELEGLPRADWGQMNMFYSEGGKRGDWVGKPYAYVVVPLHGPGITLEGVWKDTWVTYHFDDKGTCTRKIKRHISTPNSIYPIWVDWPAGEKAEDILKREEEKLNRMIKGK